MSLGDLDEKVAVAGVGCFGLAVIGACGIAGAFVGMGAGYVLGNIIDYIPLINQVAPLIAEYVGFEPSPDMNENFYQLTMGVSGFYGGIKFIPELILTE